MPDVVLPHNLQNGPTRANDATEVMANFNAILAVLNGGLDAENLADLMKWGTDDLPALGADDDVDHKDIAHGLPDTPTWAGAVAQTDDAWVLLRVHTIGNVTFRVEARAIAADAYPVVVPFLWLALA